MPVDRQQTQSSNLVRLIQSRIKDALALSARNVIAYSGGLDSTVLLHACVSVRDQSQIDCNLLAVHIDHQLSVKAASWAEHCASTAKQWQIAFETQVVEVDKRQSSLEAAARSARYTALQGYLTEPHSALFTAHHANDQAETMLLRLARGAGLPGLRGIHAQRQLASATMKRPLLSFSREQLEAYASHFQLSWIEDESNNDELFDRNFLRHSILPLLETRWSSIVSSLSHVARQADEQLELLDELAKQDISESYIHDYIYGPHFDLEYLQGLDLARAKNLMRFFLSESGADFNREQWNQFELICRQKNSTSTLQFIANENPIEFRAYDEKLFLCDSQQLETLARQHRSDIQQSALFSEQYQTGLGTLRLEVLVQQSALADISNDFAQWSDSAESFFVVASRDNLGLSTASSFKSIQSHGHQHQLKKLFQANRVPRWLRADYPVLIYEDELVAVPGIAVADAFKPGVASESVPKKDKQNNNCAIKASWLYQLGVHL